MSLLMIFHIVYDRASNMVSLSIGGSSAIYRLGAAQLFTRPNPFGVIVLSG